MNLLESWAIVMWLVYADGEANQFVPPNAPTIIKHLSQTECEKLIVAANEDFESLVGNSEKIVSGHAACFKIQDNGRKL